MHFVNVNFLLFKAYKESLAAQLTALSKGPAAVVRTYMHIWCYDWNIWYDRKDRYFFYYHYYQMIITIIIIIIIIIIMIIINVFNIIILIFLQDNHTVVLDLTWSFNSQYTLNSAILHSLINSALCTL